MPGTLARDPNAPETKIHLITYGPAKVERCDPNSVTEAQECIGKLPVTWIQVVGLGDIGIIRSIGETFGLHRLAVEDIVHTSQRAKVEQYEDSIFIVARPLKSDATTEQISMVLGKDYLITFQERESAVFQPVEERIKNGKGRIQGESVDYLMYAVFDSIVDHYFPILETFDIQLETLEDDVFKLADQACGERLHRVGQQLRLLLRNVVAMRAVTKKLLRDGDLEIADNARFYLRDTEDHICRIEELVRSFQDHVSDLMNLHLAMLSTRMNEVMKILAAIATIFLPLSFVAGLYGMNFDPTVSPWNMPELSMYLGYPLILGLMGLVFVGMIIYFRRKRWL